MDARDLLPRLVQAARSGPDAVLAAVDAPLRALGFAPRATASSPRAVLWRRGDARVALSGHVDVVPVGEGWTRDPFGGEVAEGRVWGRGACDMLGSVACFVGAAALARDAPAAILLTTDEETTMHAARHALDEAREEGCGFHAGRAPGAALKVQAEGDERHRAMRGATWVFQRPNAA
ncbi:MAG TPA: M20/M25/M40 family metallo-hydrolase, partial [Candidatus Thermoplasmatota archaeon]|nr:M20/M25/M40 family metallo-hydrolase [Candidatus Thermoplasmatota archaeon]